MKFLSQIILRSPIFPVEGSKNENYFLEALYLTSPDLYFEYLKYIDNTLKIKKKAKKLKITLYKYKTRASIRCTPFGLFSGVSVGKWNTLSEVLISSNSEEVILKRTRLDMNLLCLITQNLTKENWFNVNLKFYPNNSIYRIGSFYRYIGYNYVGEKRIHKLFQVDYSRYLELVFRNCSTGAYLSTLKEVLISNGITELAAGEFIEELISAQLLVSELEPILTEKDYLKDILETLATIALRKKDFRIDNIVNILKEISSLIQDIDKKHSNEILNYRIIFEKIKLLLPNASEKNFLQTDLFKRLKKATLAAAIRENISKAVTFLNKINPNQSNKNLEDFKRKFVTRYENTEIPLLHALDLEIGIGYPIKDNNGINPLIDDLQFPKTADPNVFEWNELQTKLHQILTEAIRFNRYSIELFDSDFEGINFTTDRLPNSMSVMFKVINCETNKLSIEYIGGSSACNLLGRFGRGNKEIATLLKEIINHEKEQNKGKVLAEIVHLPENRTGNILSRPRMHQYEIPYLARSGVRKKFQIEASDLLISVKNNFVILRSKRLNKEIIPRLGNAHNFTTNSLPVYNFLGDLQFQYFEKASLSFNWGTLADQYIFLPRVEYNNVILAPATWQLKYTHFKTLIENENSINIYKLFEDFCGKHKIPKLFQLVVADNKLFIDTEKNEAIEVFISELKNKQAIVIEEFLFDDKCALIKDLQGNSYTNECIAIMLNNEYQHFDQIKNKLVVSQRHFIVGSEWLYYKIYCGIKTADYILKNRIKSLIECLISQKIINKWFFIRYADPDTHLRLRMHFIDLSKYKEVLETINRELSPLISEGLVQKIQTDTYTKEFERYGEDTMELSEDLFYSDSVCSIKALSSLSSEEGDESRWRFGIMSTNQYLDDFKLTMQEKYYLISMLSKSFFEEHKGEEYLKLQLDSKFRKLKSSLECILDHKEKMPELLRSFLPHLEERSQLNSEIISKILNISKKNKLEVNFNDFLSSHIHMNINRLFMSRQRTNEFIIYDILARYYKSSIAKAKYNNLKT
ncbi:MAG: lantibiotic dehydratase [Bacteroidia bacterium]